MKKLTVIIILFFACVFSSACSLFAQVEAPHVHSYDEWIITVRPTCTEDGERERYCSCGERQTGKMASLGHDTVVHEGLEPTCTEDGYAEYCACSRCGFGDEITVLPATGHKFETHEGLAPTCTQSGYGEYEECVYCGLSDYAEIPALGHEFGEWIETRVATCLNKGEQTRVCLHDEGHTEVRETPKLAHTFAEIKVEPTCENSGYFCLRCEGCGFETDFEEIPALGHDFGEWTITVAPSCFGEGERMRVCSRNEEHTQTEILPKIEHASGEATLVPPTCEAAGLSYTECVHCHTLLSSEVIPALGHDFGEWTVIPATCTSEGVSERVCSRDESHVETVYAEMLPHTAGEWITDGATRYRECTVCHTELEREQIIDESGLLFELSADGESYAVSGVALVSPEMVIPSERLGKPVTEILTSAFSGCEIQSLTIPESVTLICANAFKDCVLTSVVFENVQGWSIYDGETLVSTIHESLFSNAGNAAESLVSFTDYIWKCEKFSN